MRLQIRPFPAPWLILFLLWNGLLLLVAHAQPPMNATRPRPGSADSSAVHSGFDPTTNEESLDLPVNPETIGTEQLHERMMLIDEQRSSPNSINLCSSSWEELVETGLLTNLQASAWVAFRKFYGCPIAWYELQAVDGFDTALIRTLQKWTTLESNSTFHSLRYSLQHGRASLMLRSTRSLTAQRGYEAGGGLNSGLSAYRGGSQEHLWQLRHTGYRHRMVLSLPKARGAYGMGDLGGGISINSDPGRPKTTQIALGDFHLRLGLGLSWNTSMSGALSSGIMGLRWMGQTIRVASGTASGVNLRGIGLMKSLGSNTQVLAWSALQRPNAQIVSGADSLQTLISSLPSGGMTRTQSEWLGRSSATFQAFGISATHQYKYIKFMIYSSLYKYNMAFAPKNLPWPAAIVPPQRNGLSGLSYQFSGKRFEWNGEWSHSPANGISSLQQLILTPHTRWQTAWIGRLYSGGYAPPFSGVLGRQSSPVNEQGFTWMIQWMGKGRSRLLGFADSYRHPLPRFGTPLPAEGIRMQLQGDWWPNKEHLIHARLDHSKEWSGRNLGFFLPSASFDEQKSWSLGWNFQSRYLPVRECRIRLDGRTNYRTLGSNPTHSVALSARIRWVMGSCRFSAQQIWVNSREGTGAFYFFEPAPRFTSGMVSVSGRAIRQVLLAECRISNELRAWVCVERTHYYDREYAGSGWETTAGPFRAACTLQLLYNLSGPSTFTHEKIAHWHENPQPEPNDASTVSPR